MATNKTASKKRSSSGSDPKSKRKVKGKMQKVMHEYKHGQLESGKSHKKVKNPKQAIAIGLSEARRSGANIPANPNQKKRASTKKKSSSGKQSSSSKKTTAKKSSAKKSSSKR